MTSSAGNLRPGGTAASARDFAPVQESNNGRLFDRFYDELRALAGYHLARERPDHTLQPTALVHEVYVRLFHQSTPPDQERTRFLSVASEMIRRILVDHARQRAAKKRGGGCKRFSFDEISMPEIGEEPVDVLDLDRALDELAKLNPRQARIVELRFFAGLSVAHTAELLGVSEGTVKGDWRIARAWLRLRLRR